MFANIIIIVIIFIIVIINDIPRWHFSSSVATISSFIYVLIVIAIKEQYKNICVYL